MPAQTLEEKAREFAAQRVDWITDDFDTCADFHRERLAELRKAVEIARFPADLASHSNFHNGYNKALEKVLTLIDAQMGEEAAPSKSVQPETEHQWIPASTPPTDSREYEVTIYDLDCSPHSWTTRLCPKTP